MSKTPSGPSEASRFRPRLVPTVLTLIGLAILIGLGTWQLERRAWKHDLIERLDARVTAPAIPLPEQVDDPEALAYRRVELTGVFLNDRELHRVSRTYEGRIGLYVITPLRLEDGREVLVNRGWVPDSLREPENRPETLVEGEVSVEGLLREGGWDGLEMIRPANDPEDNAWLWMDLPAMAAAADLANPVTDVYVDLVEGQSPGDLPVAGQTTLNLPDNHLQYALTWFSLAVILAAIYVISQRRPR